MGRERYSAFLACLALAGAAVVPDSGDGKWVWGRDRTYTGAAAGGGNRRYTTPQKPLFQASSSFAEATNDRLRYEVTEPPYVDVRPDAYRPERPVVRPPGPYRPVPPPRPDSSFGPDAGFRPRPPYEERPGLRPRPPGSGRPVLTGPIPSWEQHHNPNRYREFDKCKCVHSFNCNTPGIKFGSCDVDKQYCCYKVRGGEGRPGPEGSRPVLAGPGGPVDRPSYGSSRPILAGPGGPVDVTKRPVPDRPFRPFSDIDRYGDGADEREDRDLEEAYRKGLASAVHETFDGAGAVRPGYFRQPERHDNRKPSEAKYGLYEAGPALPEQFARSAPTNATSTSLN